MSGEVLEDFEILGGGHQNDILEFAVFQPTRGLYQPVDYSEQFDLQWELALDTLRSMRLNINCHSKRKTSDIHVFEICGKIQLFRQK